MFETIPSLIGQQVLYALLVACVVALVIRYGKVKSPLLRQGLWSLVLIRLVLPLDLSAPFSLREAGDQLYAMAKDKVQRELPVTYERLEATVPDLTPTPIQVTLEPFEGRYDQGRPVRAVSDVTFGP